MAIYNKVWNTQITVGIIKRHHAAMLVLCFLNLVTWALQFPNELNDTRKHGEIPCSGSLVPWYSTSVPWNTTFTPLKTNISPAKWWLEDVFPIEIALVLWEHVDICSFSGVYHFLTSSVVKEDSNQRKFSIKILSLAGNPNAKWVFP